MRRINSKCYKCERRHPACQDKCPDYGRVQDISRLDQDAELQILLAGCIDPDLKSTPLQHKFGGITPAETLKAMLLPGEIADLSREVERLSGYRRATIEKVKNA